MRLIIARWGRAPTVALLFTCLLLSACEGVRVGLPGSPSALEPHGPAAARVSDLWWLMLTLGTGVFVLVAALLAASLMRSRSAATRSAKDDADVEAGRNWVLLGGVALPLVVIGIVFGYSTYTLAALERTRGSSYLAVEVIGRRWWWEVRYPAQQIVTANEIHIPTGVPVRLSLQSGDVIHSFWVPALHGKMDAIPTRVNHLSLEADQPGVYRGECAEFCGLQHAQMGLLVIAESQEDFARWLAAEQEDAQEPTEPAAQHGQQVFLAAGCVFCHTVRGLEDKDIDRSGVDLGPDLTHLAGRLRIAAATLPQNKETLAAWITDPQHIKPGSLMPKTVLAGKDLEDLLAYLATLR